MYSIIDVRTGAVVYRCTDHNKAEDWLLKYLGDDRYQTDRKYFETIGRPDR